MSKKTNRKFRSIVSIVLTICMMTTLMTNVFAAQSNEYVDPADSWLSSNNRTNELDVNATTTYETQFCSVCQKQTMIVSYRVPEYTKSGETALNRGVMFSDGTCADGKSNGNLDSGTPGVDAFYTGYHWTKSVCQTCGTINTASGPDIYSFNNNVYGLYSCDHNFFVEFDSSTYEPHNEDYHLTTLKRGEYCRFCKGTFARATQGLDDHAFTKSIESQLGNHRFCVTEVCDICHYETEEYVAAKAVIASYYGIEDGEAHTLTVNDLSDSGVKTSIRYGTAADRCTKTSAPNYTQTGYYTVYYEIDYSYAGEVMTENGVSYIHIVADDEEDNNANGTIIVLPQTHEHEFHYIETVKPSCEELGYERFQCDGCGQLDKRNYTPALGHDYDEVVIREATCKQGGLVLTLCTGCGDFYQTTTQMGEHKYKSVNHNATCRNVGYTEYTCEVCGDNYINNIQPLVSHAFERIVKEKTCVDKGYTTSTCTMCGLNTVSDYTEPTGHEWDEGHAVTSSTCEAEGVTEYNCINCNEKMIMATSAHGHTPGVDATCTTPQLCEDCGTVLENALGHEYSAEVTEPTCTAMGYTTYTCSNCGDSYIGDYTDKAEHKYSETVTEPTCTSHGFTTYKCDNCDEEYVSDYVDVAPHAYKAEITKPSCTAMGYTTYICKDCGERYVGDYTDMLEHNYNKETIEPTCTEHGYAVYTCPDCGKAYIGDYTANKEHTYTETVIEPTCTQMGYTVFKCNDCEEAYKGNYTDKIPHDYDKVITEPTCTAFGYTTYTCKNCDNECVSDYTDKKAHSYTAVVTDATCLTMGYTTYTCDCGESYKAAYIEPLGHTASEWIIDVPATIENAGSKHMECMVCKEIMQTAAIAQLVESDRTDEDGNAKVGRYSIILTDKDGIPVFDSEISIDVNDNVTIKLPSGRLLDFEDQTTISAFVAGTQEPVKDLRIFVYDANNNAATGATDENGQLKVPNNKSSTGSDNGTIGTGNGEKKETYVVTVTDKSNVVIPDCEVYIGESNHVVVDLPEGIKPTKETPVIVTITDHNGEAQAGVTVIALGDADFIEKGKTDIYGKIKLPTASDGYTDEDGRVSIDELNVMVQDENGVISGAYVQQNKDGTISVTLPDENTISYKNRITVTVLQSNGTAVKDKCVTVKDREEAAFTALTDENGKVVVPPLHEDVTDNNGNADVEETRPNEKVKLAYQVHVNNTKGSIMDAFVKIEDGKITVILPETHKLTTADQTTVTVTDNENKAVKGVSVTIKDKTTSKFGTTDANGKVKLPVKSSGGGGSSYVATTVKIVDKHGKNVSVTKSVTSTKATLTLPTGKNLFEEDNYYTITVTSGAKAKADYPVVLKDKKGNEISGTTDENGMVILPGKKHKAYIFGYDDGTFRADHDMSRAEASAIFARLIAEEKGETVSGKAGFSDVDAKHWAYKSVGYLAKYDIIKGYEDGTFKPDNAVTRAEFVAMAVRYFALFNKLEKRSYTVNYADLHKSYWAYDDIAYAKHIGWLNGYADGTFKGDNNITRAEVVTVINHATNRMPDEDYINKNVSILNKFTDLKNNAHWAYYDIMEAANTHLGAKNNHDENWIK